MIENKSVIVTVESHYVIEQSDPHHHKYVWTYQVTITNNSDEILQLLHRYWRIADATGKLEEVHGAGVVGLQPLIKPGKQFHYTSYCQLATPRGAMEGHYEFQNLDEKHYSVVIPKFELVASTTVTGDEYRSKLH